MWDIYHCELAHLGLGPRRPHVHIAEPGCLWGQVWEGFWAAVAIVALNHFVDAGLRGLDDGSLDSYIRWCRRD